MLTPKTNQTPTGAEDSASGRTAPAGRRKQVRHVNGEGRISHPEDSLSFIEDDESGDGAPGRKMQKSPYPPQQQIEDHIEWEESGVSSDDSDVFSDEEQLL